MTATAIILPMLAVVLLTFLTSLRLLQLRSGAIKSGKVSLGHFRAMQGQEPPEKVAAAGRAYMNLFEVPPIFYAVCLALLATNLVDTVFLGLAWVYVALRVTQTLIHLTYNNVMHRMVPYLVGWFVLIAMWVRLGLTVA